MEERDPRQLIVWQKSMDLVVEIYMITKSFPTTEKFGIVSQMRRCAVSIPSNIAEGRRRGSIKEFKNFLHIAFGSAAELDTQLEISKRLEFVPPANLKPIEGKIIEILKMLNSLIKSPKTF